jgi:hypothetical protein
MAHIPFFFLLGNHDRYGNLTDYLEAFYLPTNSVTGTEHYYSFDHGDAHFACLETDVQGGANFREGSPQWRWLDDDLARSDRPWKLLFLHHPLRTSGYHRNDDYNLNAIPDRLEFQEAIGRLAAKHGVHVLFQAHEHVYEKFNPIDGVHLVTTGGGGYKLYNFGGVWDEATSQFSSRYHFLEVTIDGSSLALRAIDSNGTPFDRLFLNQTGSAPSRHHSSWHTPKVLEPRAVDGDGNRLDQSYDLAGTPIHARTGRRSNLGRFHINHDQNYLFLGVEQALLYSNQVVLVFLECPALKGVSSLDGLGNSQIDPKEQGVDGLDFLSLSFTNFNPSVAGVLGDEWADQPQRDFARPGMPFASGQGVFYLNGSLDDVPGVLLDQFNRSPQNEAGPGEQNADFMEVAIPLRYLGDLWPGDRIKVAAVVASFVPRRDGMGFESRLDSGFVGTGLLMEGPDAPVLEGMEVVLDAEIPGRLWLTVTSLEDSRIRLSWPSIPGNRYMLEHAEDIQGPFLPFQDPIFPLTATQSRSQYLHDLAPGIQIPRSRFYRIRQLD